MWFLPLLPPILPHLSIPPRKATLMVLGWIGAQALWLGIAYQLEFRAREVFLPLWAAGIVLFAVSVWVLGEVIEGWDVEPGGKEGRRSE